MALVWGPPAAPPGAPEPEEAELEEDEGGRGGLDLGLKPAESRLISIQTNKYRRHITQCVCIQCVCVDVFYVCVYSVCLFVLLTLQSLYEFQLRARRLSGLFFYGALQLLQHFLLYRSGTELHHSVFVPKSHTHS